jgi:hypothetical protein
MFLVLTLPIFNSLITFGPIAWEYFEEFTLSPALDGRREWGTLRALRRAVSVVYQEPGW